LSPPLLDITSFC